MRFLHPSSLPWALLIAVPIVLYLFRRKPRTVRVSTLIFFKSLAREHQESAWLRRLKRLLSLLLNLLIIVWVVGALARPVVAPPAGSVRSVVVLVDRSASMGARDERGTTRLEAARTALRQRLEGLPSGVAVMVVAYDRRAEILQPFTLDRREVNRALNALRVRPIEGDPDTALRLAARFAALDTPAGIWHATDEAPRGEGRGAGEEGEVERESVERETVERESVERESVERKAQETKDAPRSTLHAPPPGAPRSTPHAPLPKAEGVSVETLPVGLDQPVNAGITAFHLRRLPMDPSRFEAFVQVQCSAAKPLEADLEVRVDGALTGIRKLTLDPAPHRRERLLIPVTAGEGKVLTLKVCAQGDVLPLDDEVHARIPELRPIRALWVSREPDPFTELALTSLGRDSGIQVYHADPSAWPPKELPDVALFDGWLPETWPENVAAIVIDPPRSVGPVQVAAIQGGLPVEALRVTEPRHPLLYGLASARIAVTQTAVLASEGPLQPLWVGPSGPLLAAGEVRGQRIAVLAFAPKRAERLPLMASYPLLFGNAVCWAAEPRLDAHGGNPRETGDLVALEGTSLTWSVPTDNGPRENTVPLRGPGKRAGYPATLSWTELDRIGLWRTDAGEAGSAALLSPRETRLPAVRHTADTPDASQAQAPRRMRASLLSGDLTRLLMWLVLAFLVIESWLFHRHAVY